MTDKASEQRTEVTPQRRPYVRPQIFDEEVFERATLLGTSGGTCLGGIGECGPPNNPTVPAK